MIHIKELTDITGFEFWFTKGISYSDLEELFVMYKKYSYSGENTNMKSMMDTEYFPTTKRFENLYRKQFMTKEEMDRVIAKLEANKKNSLEQ